MPTCIEWGQERHQSCDSWEDQGYNSCSDWNPWWAWICIGFTWVAHMVCVVWTWVTTAFCVAWDVVTLILNGVFVTLESLLGWVVSLVALIIEVIEIIPVLGAVVRWILNGITYVLWIILALVDALMGLIGIRPEKILRVCTVILRDETGTPMATVPDIVAMLQLAATVYKRDANIRLVSLGPFKYRIGFLGADTVDASWVQIEQTNSDTDTLDSPCNPAGEWWLPGFKFQQKVSSYCFFGAWRRVLGYGAPVTVFIDRSTPPSSSGCGMGIVDFVTVNGVTSVPGGPSPSPRTIGHEIGHASSLWHICVDAEEGPNNLMAASNKEVCGAPSSTAIDRVNPVIADWQVLIMRASKHATYF